MNRRTIAFTDDELAFMQTASTSILTAAANGGLDLNDLARFELAQRGLDHEGHWIGFERAREVYERSKR